MSETRCAICASSENVAEAADDPLCDMCSARRRCAHCEAEPCGLADTEALDGQFFCADCTGHCSQCDNHFPPDEMLSEDFCTDCGQICAQCDAIGTDYLNCETRTYCRDCASVCDDCGVVGTDLYSQGNTTFCLECGSFCESCEELCITGALRYHEDNDCSYCESCWPSDGGVDREWDADFAAEIGIGIEVELECVHRGMKIPDLCGLIPDHWGSVSDCSLTKGREAISPPLEIGEWFAPETLAWVDKAREAGARGGRNTGLHVHFSRELASPKCVYVLDKLFWNTEFTRVLSGRKNGVHEWDYFCRTATACAEKARYYAQGYTTGEKFSAINLIHRESVEFRIFGGRSEASAVRLRIGVLLVLVHWASHAERCMVRAPINVFLRFAAWIERPEALADILAILPARRSKERGKNTRQETAKGILDYLKAAVAAERLA